MLQLMITLEIFPFVSIGPIPQDLKYNGEKTSVKNWKKLQNKGNIALT